MNNDRFHQGGMSNILSVQQHRAKRKENTTKVPIDSHPWGQELVRHESERKAILTAKIPPHLLEEE
jgi:hypothetical protein